MWPGGEDRAGKGSWVWRTCSLLNHKTPRWALSSPESRICSGTQLHLFSSILLTNIILHWCKNAKGHERGMIDSLVYLHTPLMKSCRWYRVERKLSYFKWLTPSLLLIEIHPNGKVKVWSESEVTQSCPTLCDPVDCSPPGSSVRGILQARILAWVAISFSRGSSRPRDRTRVSQIAGRHFTIWATKGGINITFEDTESRAMENIKFMTQQVCINLLKA